MYYIGPEATLFLGDSVPVPDEVRRTRSRLAVTGEFAFEPARWNDLEGKFWRRQPEMGEGGGRCSRSGFYFPDKFLVDSGGRKVGVDFFHEDPNE